MWKKLFTDIHKYFIQYLILFLGIISALAGFFIFTSWPMARIISVITLGIFYTAWGTLHHLLARNWHLKVSLEYLFIAIIGCGLLLSIILRG